MRKITFLLLLCVYSNYAQNIVNTSYTSNGNHFIYNSNIVFRGTTGGVSPVFSKYDGTLATSVENPIGYTNVYSGSPINYNGNFYFKSTGNLIGKYDGTTVLYIEKINPSDIGISSNLFLYNNKINYIYRNASVLRQLATYDGTSQVIYPNPDAATSAYSNFLSEYNGEQYFSYVNQGGRTALAKFNGATISLVNNPNTSDWGIYSGNSCVINNELVFLYQTSDGKVHFAKYDGTNITVVPNLAPSDDLLYSRLIAFNGAVYAKYKNGATGKQHFAKYDGTTLIMLPNINSTDTGQPDSPFIYKNKLYFRYTNATTMYNLARTDGSTIELVPSASYVGDNLNNPLELNGEIYFRSVTPSNYYTLAKYDGTNFIAYTNATNTDPEVFSGDINYFNNKVYFIANGKLSYLDQVILANENFQKNDFKIYPNPSNGIVNIETNVDNIGATVEVHNLLGQRVKSFALNQIQNSVSLDNGMYIVTISKGNVKTSHKIVIE